MAWHQIVLLLLGGLAGLFVVIGRRHVTAAGALGLVVLCVGASAWVCDAMLVARLSAALGLVIVLSAPLWSVSEAAPLALA